MDLKEFKEELEATGYCVDFVNGMCDNCGFCECLRDDEEELEVA